MQEELSNNNQLNAAELWPEARTPQGMDGTLTLIFAKLETT